MSNRNDEIADSILLINAIQANNSELLTELLQESHTQGSLDAGLCWAARLGHVQMVASLVHAGASVHSEVWGGFTPILWAAIFSGSVNVIQLLVSRGADINHRSTQRKQTALHAAVIKGDHILAQFLIENGANIDALDYLCKTPLLHAVQRNLHSCVRTLILNNCNVNTPGFVNGATLSPLLVALMQNNADITKMLLLAGARFEQTAIYQTFTLRQYYRTVEDDLQFVVRPVFLKQQCRVSIRELLKPHFLAKLRQMELPPALRAFLGMDELNNMF